jgi:hypothetical protein
MVAYCSSCREDRGRHTHRGSYSSSHDWLQRHDSRRRDDWNPCHQHYIRVISLVKGGEIHSDGESWGAASKTVHSQGEQPQRDIPFSIDVKGGEIVTLMWRDEHLLYYVVIDVKGLMSSIVIVMCLYH